MKYKPVTAKVSAIQSRPLFPPPLFDRIFVFNEGRIAEVGSYPELVQQGGLFRELVLSAENGLSSPLSDTAA